MSGSSADFIGAGFAHTTVTSSPRRTNASAISTPMYPPPTTIVCSGFVSSTTRRTSMPSSRVCTP